MELKNKYAIGCLIMFYEIEMMKDWVQGILNMTKDVKNKENIILDIHFSTDENFEEIDTNKISVGELQNQFMKQIKILNDSGIININRHGKYIKYKKFTWWGIEPMSIARYRREFTNKYANKVDYIMWGETDSFFPAETFQVMEQIAAHSSKSNIHKYVVSFAYRKMWDKGWRILEHPEFMQLEYIDTDEWTSNNIASEKCYMSIRQMNQLNEKSTHEGFDLMDFDEPKFDGSCICFSSELVKSGITLPHALLMSGEDTAFGWMAKKVLGNNYTQYHVRNLLRVHNRRHPKKRLYIKGENNPKGFCGESDKGKWWKIMENMSKENLANLDNPRFKFHTWKDVFEKINA